MDKLTSRVYETIRRERLFQPGARVLVGVSGGADSIALLHILHELAPVLHLDLAVAHFNHGWRGAESDADQALVEETSTSLGLPFFVGRPPAQRDRKETLAREDRYRFLFETARRLGAGAVAVGHNANDSAETLLINLIRGAGPDGLSGIAPIRTPAEFPDIALVRPLLEVYRRRIEMYLNARGFKWREDSSNLNLSFERNRVRHEVLPLLHQINREVVSALNRTAAIMRGRSEEMEAGVSDWLQRAVRGEGQTEIDLAGLAAAPPSQRMYYWRGLLRTLSPGLAGIYRRHLLDLDRLALQPDHGRLDLPGLTATKCYQTLTVSRRRDPAQEWAARHAKETSGVYHRAIDVELEPLRSEPPAFRLEVWRAALRRLRGGFGARPEAELLRLDAIALGGSDAVWKSLEVMGYRRASVMRLIWAPVPLWAYFPWPRYSKLSAAERRAWLTLDLQPMIGNGAILTEAEFKTIDRIAFIGADGGGILGRLWVLRTDLEWLHVIEDGKSYPRDGIHSRVSHLAEKVLPAPGRVELPDETPVHAGMMIEARLVEGLPPGPPDFFRTAGLSAGAIRGELRVRSRRPGDRYRPAGMTGWRRLDNVFNQLRVRPYDRDYWPLLVDDEEILWVPGMRPAEKAAVRAAGPVLLITLTPPLG